MIYQLRANLFIEDEANARRIYNYLDGKFSQAKDINPDELNAELSIIELIENNHDTDPRGPCDCIERKCSYPPHID